MEESKGLSRFRPETYFCEFPNLEIQGLLSTEPGKHLCSKARMCMTA